MTLHTLTGFMTDITAAEVAAGGFAVAVFPLVGHPVTPEMGNRFLMFMTVDAVAGIVTISAEAAVMSRFNPVAGGFPAEDMVFRLLSSMTFFTESLTIWMTVVT